MPEVSIFDPTYGTHYVARSISEYLGQWTLEEEKFKKQFPGHPVDDFLSRVENRSFVRHNGREHGIVIMASLVGCKRCGLLSFGEHRNSDAIFVEKWTQDAPFNAPNFDSVPEEAYQARKYFDYNQIVEASDYIRKCFGEFLLEFYDHIIYHPVKNALTS